MFTVFHPRATKHYYVQLMVCSILVFILYFVAFLLADDELF